MNTTTTNSVSGSIRRAVVFLHSLGSIRDLTTKIGRGHGNHLRVCCLMKLQDSLGLSPEEAAQAVDTFIGSQDMKQATST